ncbi:DUF1127 domain-containing protein [Methylobacterium frigidaeris]|uniref:YjiS-like domain-containing protein n=1 Tax=Methylobacterium frigidaeris TaxID=2038277 RepID=A0AA37HAZ8_9HYPH|nr:DUF1127 domain-containing protein [Methylobacterium frigidaeris]GJD62673.1 hypothetical protein MPEAHAMD_2830 [Methylobacterium frigidaeris]
MAATVIPFPMHRVAGAPRVLTVSHAHEPRLAGVAILQAWFRRWAARRHLARELPFMTDETLADVGLSRAEARAEARRPFWQAGVDDAA